MLECHSSGSVANGGLLIAIGSRGVRTTKVEAILDASKPNDSRIQIQDACASLRRLVAILRHELVQNFDQQAEIICRTLFSDEFPDRFEPINNNYLSFRETMTRFFELTDRTVEPSNQYVQDCAPMLESFYEKAVGRAFISTDKGLSLQPRTKELSRK